MVIIRELLCPRSYKQNVHLKLLLPPSPLILVATINGPAPCINHDSKILIVLFASPRNCKCHIYKILTFSGYIYNIEVFFTRNSFTRSFNLNPAASAPIVIDMSCPPLFVSANIPVVNFFKETFSLLPLILYYTYFRTKVNIKLFIFRTFLKNINTISRKDMVSVFKLHGTIILHLRKHILRYV